MNCTISERFLYVQLAASEMSDYKIEGAAYYMEVGYYQVTYLFPP